MFICFSYNKDPSQQPATHIQTNDRVCCLFQLTLYTTNLGPKMHYLSQVCQTIRVPSIAFTGLFSETSSRRSSSSYTAQISANFRLHTYIWDGCDFSEFNMLFIHGPLALFCLFSSSCEASFNMSVASLCMSSLDRATACM